MIGVISKEKESGTVEEFFQLFKTPWEFYKKGNLYDVVLSTRDIPEKLETKLVVIYGGDRKGFDQENSILLLAQKGNKILEYGNEQFPTYGDVSVLNGRGRPIIRIKGTGEPVGLESREISPRILRIGFNLFEEIGSLLSRGQPASLAHIPTIEIHVLILRFWILQAGIPLLEIPPVPRGYNFLTCLTHDVDFVGIKKHFFDHTMFGFLYRALFGTSIDVFRRRASFGKLFKNLKAVLFLPFVYIGLMRDFWNQFARYMEIEDGLASTFFIIPFKGKAGKGLRNSISKKRECKYDISEILPDINYLISRGCEIGLHGIDAWLDERHAGTELKRIRSSVANSSIGVRMHWLYFTNESPMYLDKAGFLYDSTCGYNDAIGYRAGTSQMFKPFKAQKMLELPLNVQDTALFYRGRMGLTEAEAFVLIRELLKNAKRHGGVFVINWHHRSIGPERCWDGFYVKLLEEIKRNRVWFATARDASNWFSKRRSITFERVEFSENRLRIKLNGYITNEEPGLLLRVYRAGDSSLNHTIPGHLICSYLDFPLSEEVHLQNI